MKKYDALIIGFGKGGKTLAAALGKKGIKTAVIEKSPLMYGGTCINIGCIPTKKLIHTAADAKKNQQADYSEKNNFYAAAIREKNTLTALLRQKNYDNVAAAADIYTGAARFQTDHTVEVQLPDGKISLYGEKIFINTGSEPVIPPITGLQLSKRVYTSTTLMELSTLPQRLVIIGGGYIGLEFAAMYANYGSMVTVLEYGNTFIPREDRDIANVIQTRLEELGVRFIFNAQVDEITDENDKDETFYRRLADGTYIFDGKTHIYDFLDVMQLDDDTFDDVKGEAETIAGLMLEIKRDFLKKGDSITSHGITFTVESVEKHRIEKIRIKLPETTEPTPQREAN